MMRSRVLLGLGVSSTVRHVMLIQSVETSVPRSRLTPYLMLPISLADTFPANRVLSTEVPPKRSPVCQTVERPNERNHCCHDFMDLEPVAVLSYISSC